MNEFHIDYPEEEPQLEFEAQEPLAALLYNAPAWDPATQAGEVAHLMRQHVALRSAFMFGLELAKGAETRLRNANDMLEIYRAQGEIRAYNQFASALLSAMEGTETPDKENEE